MKFKTNYANKTWKDSERKDPCDKKSRVKQGMVLSTDMAIKRALNGSIVDKVIEGTFHAGSHDSFDFEKLNEMELVEQREFIENESKYYQDKLGEIQNYLDGQSNAESSISNMESETQSEETNQSTEV